MIFLIIHEGQSPIPPKKVLLGNTSLPLLSYQSIAKNNRTAFLSNYPINLSAPSPQLFNLVRFGHKCFSSSRSHHKNAWFWKRLQDCSFFSIFNFWSTPSISHWVISFPCIVYWLWRKRRRGTGMETLGFQTLECGKHPQQLWMLTPEGPSQSSGWTFTAS